MRIVLDASMALAWIFERKLATEIKTADEALLMLAQEETETWVPPLWFIETSNALLVAERRHVIKEAQVIDYLSRLSELSIMSDEISIATQRNSVMALAREYGLTAYDATYLELALRKNAILATFDVQLANAMQSAGGVVFNAYSTSSVVKI
ncbi:MAG: type II toxin-antitoxin system VapC family toxin [Legionellales bacterium]|nr:type II toxin-antitoxin system VapC family toxin [Legionellales bacterium]